jgi:uncharacterized protein YdhG (YjbR/CyaY superfamily)
MAMPRRTEIEATGYDVGSGMIKLPYDKQLQVAVLTLLMKARLDDYNATGAKW